MAFKFSDKPQRLWVFNYLADTCEFIGSGEVYVSPGTGLPAHCTDVEPPDAEENFAAVYDVDSSVWRLVPDYRRKTVYKTDTGEALLIMTLGALPEGVTDIAPVGDFQKWDGSGWGLDEEARLAADINAAIMKRDSLRANADAVIAWLSDAVDMGVATDEESAQLVEWKKYRVLLMRVDTSKPEWPEEPGNVG